MKVISSFLLIISLAAITALTTYTLMHQKIEGTRAVVKVKSIEKATSNMTANELSETYNIELNDKRHKLKSVYSFYENTLTLTLYLDGFEILDKLLEETLEVEEIQTIFNEEELNYPIITEEDIAILNTDKNYLLVKISSNINNLKEEYFVWNDKRLNLLENILVYDSEKTYETEEPIFYDEERQVTAKVEDNKIYALEETEEGTTLEEYVYEIENDEVSKELINTYNLEQ